MAPTPEDAAPTDVATNKNNDKPVDNPRDGTAPLPKRRRQKQLSTDTLNWNIPRNHEATLHVQEEEGHDSWRYKLIKTLHGRRVQATLAALLLLDVLILFCELSLLTFYPACHLVERDAISCCPIVDENDAQRFLAGSDYYSCAPGWQPVKDESATCDSHKWHTVHTAETVLICLTLAILTIFFIELTLCMIALTPAIFFRQLFYALDYAIVTVSLGLEVLFFSLDDKVLTSLVGLVILGRLWRFIRIGHGILEIAGELKHEQHVQEVVYTQELEDLLRQHGIPLPDFIPHHASHHDDGALDADNNKDSNHCADLLERVHQKHIAKLRRTYHESHSREEE